MLFVLLCILAVGLFRPYIGLIILVVVGPFFTLIHELTPGFSLLFLWPFLLVVSITLSIIFSECKSLVQSPDYKGRFPHVIILLISLGALILMMKFGDLLNLVTAKKLSGFEIYLGDENLFVLSGVMALGLFSFLAVYFRAMERNKLMQ